MTKGEYSEYEQRVERFFKREGINSLSCTEDCESSFSVYNCEVCGALPGNRHRCSGYNPVSGNVQGGYEVCEDCLYYVTYGRLPDDTMMEMEDSYD